MVVITFQLPLGSVSANFLANQPSLGFCMCRFRNAAKDVADKHSLLCVVCLLAAIACGVGFREQ